MPGLKTQRDGCAKNAPVCSRVRRFGQCTAVLFCPFQSNGNHNHLALIALVPSQSEEERRAPVNWSAAFPAFFINWKESTDICLLI